MRYFLIGSAFVVIIVALAVIWFYPSSGSQESLNGTPPDSTFPGTGNTSTSSSSSPDSILLSSSSGASISVRNFLSDSDVGTLATGYYYLGFHASADPYQIIYQSSSRIFTIELLKEPIGTARTQAEQYLMTKLGLSQSDLCSLDYTLSVPQSVNSTYASRNLLFSFCPGAVSLPE